MTVATVLAWLGPIGKAVTAAGRWIRARVKGHEKDWTIGGLVLVILLLLWWTSVSRRESAFYAAVNRGLESSLKGTGQNERVLLARIANKDKELEELRSKKSDVRCDGDWTETIQPDGTRTRRCVGKSESAETEELRRALRELEARAPLPFIQPPPLQPLPSLTAPARSRWSAGGGAIYLLEDARWTGYGRAGYRLAGPWTAEVTVTAPVWGAGAGISLQP